MSLLTKTATRVIKKTQKHSLHRLKPIPKAMIEFIHVLYGEAKKPIWFQTYGKGNADSFSSKLSKTLRDRIIKDNANGLNISVAVNTIEGNQRKAENVTKINAVFIDLDDQRLTLEQLMALPVVPHIVIETSPSKFHVYWLTVDCKISEYKAIQKALAKHFKSDAQVCDSGRVMRLPGTINWNYPSPFLARIVHLSTNPPIRIKKLVKKLKLQVELQHSDARQVNDDDSRLVANKINQLAAMTTSNITTERIQEALDRIEPNDRSNWLYAGMAIHSEMPNQTGYTLWSTWSSGSSKYDEKDQRRTWDNFKVGNIKIGTLFWLAGGAGVKSGYDNFAMGALFAKNYASQLRYDDALDKWYAFNGIAWREDKKAPMRLAKALISNLSAGELRKHEALAAYRSPAGLNTIVKMAETEKEELGISETDFNSNPMLLATQNGVIDLVTRTFRHAEPHDYLRRQVAVAYDPKAKCPRWKQFILEITCGDKELAYFLRLAVGYTLFGHGKEQVFFVLDGAGSNGKGVFLRILHLILGEFAVILPPSLITSAFSGSANSSSPALMAIQGTRLGIVTETSAKKGFDTAFMKQISGSDPMSARANYGAQTTIKPECKLWLSTNNMPEIRANDDAMWRRIVPIPFKAHFPKDKRDNHLETNFKDELPGILNWALAGARDYENLRQLPVCSAVEKHKRQMQRDADVCGTWLKECTTPSPKRRLQSSEAYASYAKFAKKIGREPMNMQAFKRRVEAEGYEHRKSGDYNVYVGLDLKAAGK